MFKKTTQTVLALSLALGAFTNTGSAQAQGTDQVVHPNSACRWETNWDVYETVASQGNHYGGMGFYDQSKPWRLLVCGIDRFNLTNTDGLRDLDVRVHNGNLDARELNCEAMSLRPDGTIVKSVHLAHTFTGYYRMDWNGALNASVAYGSYVVQCALPPQVVVNNILQREY
jgi:hypothetical protein